MKYLFIAFSLIYGVACVERTAIVIIQGANNVYGRINFTQHDEGPVHLAGHISGISPGNHGFHVHEKGDLSNGCVSAGGHFNPHNKEHGAPADSERHVGDLGNIQADRRGVATINFQDSIISLTGVNSIIGRAVVVHAGEDDLGLGGHADSKKTGNAGGRLGCGIIGVLYNSGMNLKAPTIYQLIIMATAVLAGKSLL